MESKDYERHSETIAIPPAHLALRYDNRYPFGSSRGLHARASSLVNKSASEPQLEWTPCC
jgi:hypothetical protein